MSQNATSPAAGARTELGKCSLPETENTPIDTRNPTAVQAAIISLKREFVSEFLRIAAVKAAHAADDIELADDLCAERGIRIAIKNLKEAAAAFRELGLLKGEGQA